MLPLEKIRVLDLTRLLPGNYATLQLADLGADVIKVEDPRGGDHARQMPPLVDGTSVYFSILNRNKRSVTLDLRAPEAAPIVDALVAQADVLVESFRPSTAKRLGVDGASLRARHPRLVHAAITGFGQSGPYVDVAAHDINYEALAGLLSLSDPPRVPPLLVADVGAAWQAVIGIVSALFARERTGVGATVDISLHEAALAWVQFPAAPHLVAGAHAGAAISLIGSAARYNLYQTADGRWLALGALEDKFWRAFCDRIGRPDLAAIGGGANEAWACDEVRAVMRTRTRDAWLNVFAHDDVCLTPVHAVDEMLSDPHVASRAVLHQEEGATFLAPPGVTIRSAPALGAHTDEVLDAIGVDAVERDRLRGAGVV